MILMIILFVLMLFALWLGSRHGGLALGAICGLALALMVFAFGLKPGTPPNSAANPIPSLARNVFVSSETSCGQY